LTTTEPVIRYDAIIEAALNGTLRRAYAADKHAAAGSTTLRKASFTPPAAIPIGPSVLVKGDEASLLARQARQRAEHAARMAKTSGIELGIGDTQKRARADADATALFQASRLRQIVPGFLAGVR
jgi:hypothetical protein